MQSLLSPTPATSFFVNQEGPLNALALNRDYSQVAIAGRNIFKVYAIEDDKFREVCNLRYSKQLNQSFSCNDVAWSTTDDHYLATAATNGHVCVWNLSQRGKSMLEVDYHDHKRTVNKVNFHASEPNKLISGSQDGTMRYFDIRIKNAVAVFYSNSESVRDVQFSPHNPHSFAAVSDNGNVQLWDIRRTDKCQQQFTAHSGPVFACDWHPETTWLATASRDRTIKVWELANKPTLEYTIHTFASIGHVKWRPQRKFHLASCALVVDCSINVWDVRRPYIPFAMFNEHKEFASGIAWRGDAHVFLTTGRDCRLYQHSFTDAIRPASQANPQSLSINKKGEVLYAYKASAVNSYTSTSVMKSTVGMMRKSSTTVNPDTFHQTTSSVLNFMNTSPVHSQESNIFVELAKRYILSGKSLSEMCDHNSNVAQNLDKFQISYVWKIIKTIYGEEFLQNSIHSGSNTRDEVLSFNNLQLGNAGDCPIESDQRSRGGGDTPAAQTSGGDDETESEDQVDHVGFHSTAFPTYLNARSGLPKGDFSFGENELDMELEAIGPDFRAGYQFPQPLHQALQDFTLPNEAFHIRHEILDRSPPPERLFNHHHHHSPDLSEESLQNTADEKHGLLRISKLPARPNWDPSNIVIEALKYHAVLGDVQTPASILIVLGDTRNSLNLDENTQEHWLLAYIDLLSRFRLWNISNQIIKLAWMPSINGMNHISTRYSTNCNTCSKPLTKVGWYCERCNNAENSLCSLCHQVVKGLYAWCRGCAHGGHLAHIKQWMSKNKVCPTGCGHECEYS